MKDLDFISGNFFETEIPKEKAYLQKYFDTDLQKAFLRYFLVFGEASAFCEHTGFACTQATIFKMEAKYHKLLAAHKAAKLNMDFNAIWEIESGKYKLEK